MSAARSRRGNRASTYRELKSAEPGTVLAAFDLDGTVVDTNVVETYLWARLPELGTLGRAREVAGVAANLPRYLGADRRDRADFLRTMYRRYQGMSMASCETMSREKAYQNSGSARQQAARGTYDPAYLNYTMGKLMIRKLRADWTANRGGRAAWREFHDRFLSYGGPPIPLVREQMLV